jgi:hypothetical protein
LTGILVSHPHAAAFSVGVATALERAGRLSAFVTGVAFGGSPLGGVLGRALAARRPVLQNRLLAALPARKLPAVAAVQLGARAGAGLLQRAGCHSGRTTHFFSPTTRR